jgi:hypothetical protein
VLGPWSLARFCTDGGFAKLDYAVLLPSEDECVRRVSQRSGHGFEDEPGARKMHHEFQSAAVDDRHVIVTDALSPEETVEELLRRRDGGWLRYELDPA